MRHIILLLAFVLLAVPARAQVGRPLDAGGWTVLTPAADAHIHYVSSSAGDDGTAVAYTPADPPIGADPTHPTGPVMPYKSIDAALKAARSDAGDWVLLLRGDSWVDSRISPVGGKGLDAPAVIGAYGDGPRPVVRVGNGPGVGLNLSPMAAGPQYLAIAGIEWYADTRDPNSPTFAPKLPNGKLPPDLDFAYQGGGLGCNLTGFLVEDCCFRFLQLTAQARAGATLRGVAIRRNVFVDRYGVNTAYAQALYVHGLSGVTIEENTFDHNGWCEDQRTWPQGKPTLTNHDIYSSDNSDIVIRGNGFFRNASLSVKVRSNSTGGCATGLIADNLWYGAEAAMTVTHQPNLGPYRFKDIVIANNVFYAIGCQRPTGRRLGIALAGQDWDHVAVVGNLMMAGHNPDVWQTRFMTLHATARNVTVASNTAWDLATKQELFVVDGGPNQQGIAVSNNMMETVGPGPSAIVVLNNAPAPGSVTFSGNLFSRRNLGSPSFTLAGQTLDQAGWTAATGDRPAKALSTDFPDRWVSLGRYNLTLGGKPTIDDLIAARRGQSRSNWRPELSAAAINGYLRGGHALAPAPIPDGFPTPSPLPDQPTPAPPEPPDPGPDPTDPTNPT